MKNLASVFEQLYLPRKAVVVYQSLSDKHSVYLEAFDMDDQRRPINAHLLSPEECHSLSQCLSTSNELKGGFLSTKGLLPENVLYIKTDYPAYAIWHTPGRQVNLFFKKGLGIPCGPAYVPPMVWKAAKNSLHVYVVKNGQRPKLDSRLYHPPFFNCYEDGKVCMGTVSVDIGDNCRLEDFMQLWEDYFFNSYFSHMNIEAATIQGNIVQLWKAQVNTGRPFPLDILEKNGNTIKDLIS